MSKLTIAIHGGAGTIVQDAMISELEAAYRNGLQTAVDAGYDILEKGGTALDAVIAATVVLEDNILFNAGRGSVFTKKGIHEMDAAIMEGRELAAGAVAGVQSVRNPVKLAYEVMKNSDHVFLCAAGANEFAVRQGLDLEPDEYFFSQFRYDQWQSIRDSDNYALDHGAEPRDEALKNKKYGTVGAVACDNKGNLAAATSTGGMTNKKFGRIGDSPLIGCGTYANNNTCAVSCTGHGEPFIRSVAAYDLSCLMEYRGLSLQDAMHLLVNEKLVRIGGEGGMIAVDAYGNVSLEFNSAGMYRGFKNSDGQNLVAIYR